MAQKSTHKPVIETILEAREGFTSAEQRAVQLLLNQPMIGLETIAAYAKKAGVSSPSILRLIRKLGFPGFADFQARLRKDLEQRLASPLSKKETSGARARVSRDASANRMARRICDNIRHSFAAIPDNELAAVINLLHDPKRRVFLIGGRLTDALARHFYLHLHAIRSQVRHVDGQTGNWPEQALEIRKNDILCVFDIRRYQTDLHKFAADANARGGAIILFTDQWLSPIAPIAKQLFCLRTDTGAAWDSTASIIALLDLIIAKMGAARWARLKGRIRDLEALRDSY